MFIIRKIIIEQGYLTVLEVSQLARSIAKIFRVNDDLVESISLSHDLGHTPFGHAGEDELNVK